MCSAVRYVDVERCTIPRMYRIVECLCSVFAFYSGEPYDVGFKDRATISCYFSIPVISGLPGFSVICISPRLSKKVPQDTGAPSIFMLLYHA